MKDEQTQKEPASREQIRAEYQAFLENEGKLPRGFSEPYIENHGNYVLHETPFREYMNGLWKRVDSLRNTSGISDWLYFDGSLEISHAAKEIIRWCELHRQLGLDHFTIPFSMHLYATQKVMVVTADVEPFRNLEESTKQACREADISFCTILSEDSLYDLLEQKELTIHYTTYPNYHDETYADWWLG